MRPAKYILVVEDERIVARDIQRSLADLGYDVPETAATAEQAILLATRRCPDLVLMDIRIKGDRDGIETAGILRRRFDVPVIYLTAYADAPTVERAKATEPLGYLLKPVKPDELRSAVEIALYRHVMEKQLRDRENWLATTLRSIGDAVISADPEGRINYMNPVAEDLIGLRLEHAIGRPSNEVLKLLDKLTRSSLENPMEHAMRVGKTISIEGFLALPAGGERIVTDSTSPIVDDRGRILGAVMVFRDVSEQKRLQLQLEHADRLASVGILAAGVAHEVNNPLAFILSNTRFALDEVRRRHADMPIARGSPDGDWAAKVEDALEDALKGIDRVRRIAADLKAFCRNVPDATAAIDLHEVLEHALALAGPELNQHARIVKKFGAIPAVEAESTRLEQVFVNILLNAAHAMPAHGGEANQVAIVTSTDGSGRAVVEVRDTGPGMTPEVLKRVFEPFFTTKDAGHGSGLGLSICHGIVRSYGGEIEIASQPGKGTVVRVALPATRMPLSEAAPAVEPPVPAGPRGYLLVIDDEPMIRTCIRRLLEDEHAITCPKTATEALALIDGGMRFDLILCDVLMPGLSGIDLHAELLSRHPDQARRMAFMSGGVFTPRAIEFMRLIPNRRIEKPFDVAQLKLLVRGMITDNGLIPRHGRTA
jgi:PAS domain S-box-containing protein